MVSACCLLKLVSESSHARETASEQPGFHFLLGACKMASPHELSMKTSSPLDK